MDKSTQLLKSGLQQLGIPFTDPLLQSFEEYMKTVLFWNQKVNLTAITDPEEFVVKHFLDSLAICGDPAIEKADHILDMGTGGGFPGIPLALIYPDKRFLLVDSLKKRIAFLQEVTEHLGLSNVTAIQGRAEDLAKNPAYREKFDLCVSRAVAKLSVLSEYCLPFVKVGGVFAAYKTAGEDLSLGEQAVEIMGGQIERTASFPSFSDDLTEFQLDHKIVFIQKSKQTPKKYPRKAGMPTKLPL